MPPARSGLWEWQLRARCRSTDSSLFYPPENSRGPVRARLESLAKDVCWQCPVLVDCRTHALRTREPYGVWGGMSAKERALWDHFAAS
ncbi:WhiB family transcriptional regulator [Rhodococcus pyridinivorans SB3094]|uniref:Transcriptional regulator WhiB n=1 Tax=Rhodococcus pyridinivorans SB3094 TaxID=1435356 RepID=V9XLZ5_9NOCA|nr:MULTISPECIES: WhiB family transcriptional regulator [Rhodococcus]AHD23398.1 WhiB family transcriptional regulator [Rhodococcus pyridinivorans SB3094]MCT7293917.1 WhiB family transcriptional regulator [Rhodococcus sp. PAE-6]